MNNSNRHHYIPIFFIKGFTNENGKLFYYDKNKNKLDRNPKSPKQLLFEWNRNTVTINDKEIDVVEKLFQLAESKLAVTYNKIIKGEILTELDLRYLILFLLHLHWRVPNQDYNNKVYFKNIDHKDSFLKIVNKKTGKLIPNELFQTIIKEPLIAKSNSLSRFIEDYLRNENEINQDNWTMSASNSKNSFKFNILSDNPLLLKNELSENILNTEIIFPFSKNKTVHHTNGKKLTIIEPEKIVAIHILSFIQAKKIVCSSNLEYLEFISELSKAYTNDKKIQILKDCVFSIYQ